MGSETTDSIPVATLGSAPTCSSGERQHVHAPLPAGTRVGRYTVLDVVGLGGMGVVYAAYDPELDRRIALKVVRLATGRTTNEDEAREELLAEARVLAQLSHPHVVAVFDVGRHEDGVFIAMELATGQTLRRWWKTRRDRSWAVVRKVFFAAGAGLAAVHRANIVHRDFKPENVIVGEDGSVRVVDFGIAQVGSLGGGSAAGTPEYMAPEQWKGERANARSDQYAFCLTLYEILYGSRPDEAAPTSTRALGKDRARPRVATPAHVLRALRRGLSPTPADRFPSMEALLAELGRDPYRSLRWGVAIALVAGAGVAMVTASRAASAERSALCKGGSAKMASVWNEPARSKVRTAFGATALSYAADVLLRTEEGLDRYAETWVRMHDDACAATRLRGEQSEDLLDARMVCLTRNLDQLTAQVRLFESADVTTLDRAPVAVQQLPPVAGCGETEIVRGAPTPPKEPAARARFDALSRTLAGARASHFSGRLDDALAASRSVLVAAREEKSTLLEAESLLLEGRILAAQSEGDGASAALWSAFLTSLASRQDERAGEAASHLVFTTGALQSRFDDARRFYGLGNAAIERVEGGALVRASLLRNWAVVLQETGDYPEGLAVIRRALPLMEKAVGPDHVNVAATLETLGNLEQFHGEPEAAAAAHGRALAIRERAFGPSHPGLAAARTNLGMAKGSLGRFTEGLALCEAADRVFASAPETNPARIGADFCRSAQLRGLRRYAEARAIDEDLLRRTTLQGAAGTVQRVYAHQSLAQDAIGENDCPRAVPHAELAVKELRAALESDGAPVAEALGLLGKALLCSHRINEAGAPLEESLKLLARWPNVVPLERADIELAAGERFLALGDAKAALPLLEASLQRCARYEAYDPTAVATTRFALARALRLVGRDEERGRELARQAIDGYRKSEDRSADRSAEVDGWLTGVKLPR